MRHLACAAVIDPHVRFRIGDSQGLNAPAFLDSSYFILAAAGVGFVNGALHYTQNERVLWPNRVIQDVDIKPGERIVQFTFDATRDAYKLPSSWKYDASAAIALQTARELLVDANNSTVYGDAIALIDSILTNSPAI